MRKIGIIYGSTTGNTENVANFLKAGLKDDQVTIVNASHANIDHIKNNDIILFGSSTWGYGDLQDDFANFIDNFSTEILNGKDVAVFGCGDSVGFSDVFCDAVNQIEERAVENGAHIIVESLKVDGEYEDNLDIIERFVSQI